MKRFAPPLALFGIVLLSRLPFATQHLWAWDSVLYARALERGFHVGFDLGDQQPHPPGYIFYVGAAALVRLIVSDSNAALVAVSMLASALCVAVVYLLARRFARAGLALFVAAAFAANPLAWTYAEVAYPYTVLGLLSTALAGSFLYARGSVAGAIAASAGFGALAGFRQDLLLLLGPLWLWLLWPRSWRARVLAAAALTAGIILWLVPSALLSGGFEVYARALLQQGVAVGSAYSVVEQGLAALSYNLRFTAYALVWGLLAFALILVPLAVAAAARVIRTGPRFGTETTFFAAWVIPGLLFYVTVHIGEWGYVLSVLPALYVLGAALGEPTLSSLRVARGGLRGAGAVVALAPALLFVFGGGDRFSAATLREHDRGISARAAYVRRTFPADRTIVLAREDFLTVRYYLPEYRTWFYDPDPYRATHLKKRAMRATAIVIFTEGLAPRQNLDVRYTQVAEGVTISSIRIDPGTMVEFSGERFVVREGP